MKYGLSDSVLEQLRGVFRAFPEIEEVVLYGSRAMGNFKPSSDIDLALMGDLDVATLSKINWSLDDLMLPYKMDTSIRSHIRQPELLDHILRVGVPIYKKGAVVLGPR
jgi:predicted nucleotidyltransferase